MKSNPIQNSKPVPKHGAADRQESAGQLLDLLDGTSDLIQCADASGRLVFVNRTWCDAMDHSAFDARELTYLDVIAPPHRDRFHRILTETIAKGRSTEMYISTALRSGEGVTIQVEGTVRIVLGDGALQALRCIFHDVTNRNQYQSRLRESEHRYRELVDGLHEVVFQTDAQGRLVFLNPAWTTVTGHPVAESLAYPLAEFVHEDDCTSMTDWLGQIAAESECTHNREFRVVCADRSIRWLQVNIRTRLDDRGKVLALCGTLVDFTERHLAEAEIRAQVVAMDEAVDGIARIDADGRYLYFNRAHYRMFGFETESDLLGKDWKIIHDADEAARLEAEIGPKLRQAGNWSGMAKARRLDGAYFPIELTLTLLPDGESVCICRDVSEREVAAAALHESEMRWQLAVDGIRDGVWDYDIPRDVVYMSPRWRSQLPVSEEDLTRAAATWKRVVHPDDWADMNKVLDAHFRRETDVFQCEHRILVIGNVYRWIMVRAQATFDENGAPQRLIGTITDITVRKEAEQRLMENLAREKELSEMRQHFVHMASHELRTPLATVSLGLELVLKNLEKLSTTQIRQNVQCAFNGVGELRAILDDLLLLGKADDGQIKCHPTPTELEPLLQKLCGAAGERDKHRHPFVTTGIVAGERVSIDPLLTSHVLSNLLSNACKYSEAGHPVTIAVTREPDHLTLVVKDEGIGIPEADQPQLFGFFVRAGNVAEIAGTGLGLLVVKYCLQAHGGSIEFQSQVGRGTQFTVTLPLNQSEA
ncbi:PAS domain-containing sensor histidine kinase [Synoicihabitans lomoniglobus]|uniref:histidine kinase n=1 Tax=Synoicihabitans lomoniglobus TaxID=2909285 RepID=A0AAF0CMH1_9BACT|nr:PAS domain-containing sensor histidine kinase [Opitutaceae bacterium LMO-M01]WED64113.1 PAS domain-containing sensor histidine kinase [Opitutaceae bacterium LMO-M01]